MTVRRVHPERTARHCGVELGEEMAARGGHLHVAVGMREV
jgi:hypothetical protein